MATRTLKKATPKRAATAARKAAKPKAAPRKPAVKKAASKRAATAKPKAAPKKPAVKKAVTKKAPSRTTAASARTLEALAKKVTAVSKDTHALSGDLRSMAKIFGDNQKILVSMKGVMEEIADALDAIQKQSKRIGSLETDTQKIFAGIGEMRAHARIIAKLDSQSTKMEETVRGIKERSDSASGLDEISKKVDESFGSIKNNSEMIIKIGRHIDGMREDIGGLSTRASSVESVQDDLARLKALFEEAQASHSGDADLAAELGAMSKKVSELSQLPSDVGALNRRLEEISGASGTLGPIVEELREQVSRVAERASAGSGDIESVRAEFSTMREEVTGRAGRLESGIASVTDALGRSEGAVAEVHKKADALFEEVRALRGEGQKAAGSSSSEIMALLRLSEYQSGVRMVAESKYGEVSDLERMASQTVDVLNVFDRLAVETGSEVRLPHGVRQWAVSKILECADRWEIRFSDVLGVLRDKLGVTLLKEAVRMSQVREVYGTRAVDELEGILAEHAGS